MRRLRWTAALIPALALILMRPGLSEGPASVIILSVDTLRSDRLGTYDYHHDTSPNIDRLLQRGVVFDNAMTNVPLTSPSFCSMFTSRYPHETGSIRNGIPMVDGIPTLAAIFKSRGFHTAAVISNWPLKARLSNLDQGFDIYDDDFHQKRWLFFNDERDAEDVTEHALEWLESSPREPFFAWIHYSDPHQPYVKHKKFMFEKSSSASARYDSEVAYADFHIGRLLEALRERGLLDRSLLVFLADHGESLGEHDYTGHGRKVYQPSMAIPFALLGPGIPSGTRSDALVQLLDLGPTVLSFAGIEVPEDMRGRDLLPGVTGRGEYPSDTIYYETYPGSATELESVEVLLKKPIWVGYRKGPRKLMYSVRFKRWESYDLARDPKELDNLVKLRDPGFKERSDELMAWYREWEDETVVGNVGVMTEEDREKFKALGYIDNP